MQLGRRDALDSRPRARRKVRRIAQCSRAGLGPRVVQHARQRRPRGMVAAGQIRRSICRPRRRDAPAIPALRISVALLAHGRDRAQARHHGNRRDSGTTRSSHARRAAREHGTIGCAPAASRRRTADAIGHADRIVDLQADFQTVALVRDRAGGPSSTIMSDRFRENRGAFNGSGRRTTVGRTRPRKCNGPAGHRGPVQVIRRRPYFGALAATRRDAAGAGPAAGSTELRAVGGDDAGVTTHADLVTSAYSSPIGLAQLLVQLAAGLRVGHALARSAAHHNRHRLVERLRPQPARGRKIVHRMPRAVCSRPSAGACDGSSRIESVKTVTVCLIWPAVGDALVAPTSLAPHGAAWRGSTRSGRSWRRCRRRALAMRSCQSWLTVRDRPCSRPRRIRHRGFGKYVDRRAGHQTTGSPRAPWRPHVAAEAEGEHARTAQAANGHRCDSWREFGGRATGVTAAAEKSSPQA